MQIKCFLSNCIINLKEPTILNIDGFEINLVQNEDFDFYKTQQYKNKWIEATTLIFDEIEEKEIPKVKEISQNISELLSFATLSPVRFFRIYKDNSFFYESHGKNGTYNSFRFPIDIQNEYDIKEFLESCYDLYRKKRDVRQLNIVIEYLVSSETLKIPMELKLATIFILLENLKKTYAEEENYPFIDGKFRYKINPKNPIGFEKLLIKMFEALDIDSNIKGIKDLRNEIIHSGLSQTPYEEQFKIYENCHDLIHLYLFHLLGYKGSYLIFSKRSNVKTKISFSKQ